MESFNSDQTINLTSVLTDDEKVSIWQVLNGKITEVLILGNIFCVRSDVPKSLDPIKAARDFLQIFDVKKTAMIRKVKQVPDDTKNKSACYSESKPEYNSNHFTKSKSAARASKIYDLSRDGRELNKSMSKVGKFRNISIFKEIVIKMYRKLPDTFKISDAGDFIFEIYPAITEPSATNKARGYIGWLLEEGYLTVVSNKTNSRNYRVTYSFIKVPFDAEKPAQADFDPMEMRRQKELELITMREA